MFYQNIGIFSVSIVLICAGCSGQAKIEDEVDTSTLFSREAWTEFKTRGFVADRARMIFLSEQLTRAMHLTGRAEATGEELTAEEFQALKEAVSLFRPDRSFSHEDLMGVTLLIEKTPVGYYNIEAKSDQFIFRTNASVTWVKKKSAK